MNKPELATKRTTRRTPVGTAKNILRISGGDPDFMYRVVNDTGDRIEQLKERGYEIVQDTKVTVGTRRINNPTKEGTPVQVSVGGGMKGFVMRIRKDWYDEDQAEKQRLVDEQERATIEKAKKDSDYGKVTVEN